MSGNEPQLPGAPTPSEHEAALAEIFDFEVPAEPAPAPAEPVVEPQPLVGTEEGEEGGLAAPPSEPAPAPAEPAPVAVPDETKLELESLRAQLAQTAQALEELKKPKAPETPAPAAPPAQPQTLADYPLDQPLPDPGTVQFKLPDAYREALLGDDGNAVVAVIEQLMSGLATHFNQQIHQLDARVLKRGNTAPASTTADVSAPDAAAIETQVKAMQEQYYAAHPTHRDPAYLPIIQVVQREMAEQFPGHPWNADYIAAFGHRVKERATQLAALTKPAKPTPSLQPGPRSAVPGPGEGDISDEIIEVLDAFGT